MEFGVVIACAVCAGSGEDGSSAGIILPFALMAGAFFYTMFFFGARRGLTIFRKLIRKIRMPETSPYAKARFDDMS